MWNPADHSDQDNLQWSWLRAVEWLGWPTFLSQAIVPVLFYLYLWQWVVGMLLVIDLFWRFCVVPIYISRNLVEIGLYIEKLKYITCPVMAVLLWNKGEIVLSVFALLWPLIASFVITYILAIPTGILVRCGLGKTAQIGPVQERFMIKLGY